MSARVTSLAYRLALRLRHQTGGQGSEVEQKLEPICRARSPWYRPYKAWENPIRNTQGLIGLIRRMLHGALGEDPRKHSRPRPYIRHAFL